MNAFVLAVAGVFVLTGITLIVLSIVLFRGRKNGEGEAAEVTPPPDESPRVEPERAFIDEPLRSDFSHQLGPAVATATQAGADTSPEAPVSAQSADTLAASADDSAADELDDPGDIAAETPVPSLANAEADAQPDVRNLGYNFRLHVAADHVRDGRLREAISEFEKALTLTDDDELRSHLLAEIGNAWRDLGEFEPAAQAYAAAAERTGNEGLRAHLRRSADEMRGSDGRTPIDEVAGEHDERP